MVFVVLLRLLSETMQSKEINTLLSVVVGGVTVVLCAVAWAVAPYVRQAQQDKMWKWANLDVYHSCVVVEGIGVWPKARISVNDPFPSTLDGSRRMALAYRDIETTWRRACA